MRVSYLLKLSVVSYPLPLANHLLVVLDGMGSGVVIQQAEAIETLCGFN